MSGRILQHASPSLKPDDPGVAHVPKARVRAGQHDDLAILRGKAQERTHAFQPRRVAVTEGVVQDEGDAVLLADKKGASEARDQRELLLGADAEAVEGEGHAPQGPCADGKVVVEFDAERLIEDKAPQGDDLVAKRRLIGAAGGMPGIPQGLEEQARRCRAPREAAVVSLRVLQT